jgi:methylglutaconyl-CoA hydratase
MSSFVHQQVERGVATITLSRPELHNAFNEEVMNAVTQAFVERGADPLVRVIVLAGAGKSFCAGADVHWMRRMVDYTFEENVADARLLSRMLRAIRGCPKPVIARVHGAAFGGGVGLTAACDFAVAVASVVFCLSEVRLGILPAVISPYVIEKIGPGSFRRYALTAERFDAAEAKRIGLVCETVESVERLDAWIEQTVTDLKENGPLALAACKQVLDEVQGRDWERIENLTIHRIAERRVSPEGQEGLKAFLEKRKPSWVQTP